MRTPWYVLRVRNMHSWSPSDPRVPGGEKMTSCVNFFIRQVKAELRILIANTKNGNAKQ